MLYIGKKTKITGEKKKILLLQQKNEMFKRPTCTVPGGPTGAGPGPGPAPGPGIGPGTTPMLGGCIICGAPLTCIPGCPLYNSE